MDLSQLSDQQLMQNTKALVHEESSVLVKILRHIKEIDRRRLYSDFKLPGLLELVQSELGYSRDQAFRRIQAMRMMRESPVVEKKLEVIEKVSGKSTREAQRIVLSMCSTPPKLNEKIKMIAPDLYELTANIDEETVQLLEKLKGALEHSHPNISNGELIKWLATQKEVAAPRPKYQVRRQIWLRDECRCTNCGSTFAIQEDHRWPNAKGGRYTTSNMRLLCRSCNQRAAIRHFGVEKMEQYL